MKIDDGYEWPITVILLEKEWRVVSESLRIIKDAGLLPDKYMKMLIDIHDKMCDQIIDEYDSILRKLKEN